VGPAVSIFALTVYLITHSRVAGYAFAFIQDVPLSVGDYFEQLARLARVGRLSFAWFEDACVRSLDRGDHVLPGPRAPRRLEDVSNVTTNAVVESVWPASSSTRFHSLYLPILHD